MITELVNNLINKLNFIEIEGVWSAKGIGGFEYRFGMTAPNTWKLVIDHDEIGFPQTSIRENYTACSELCNRHHHVISKIAEGRLINNKDEHDESGDTLNKDEIKRLRDIIKKQSLDLIH